MSDFQGLQLFVQKPIVDNQINITTFLQPMHWLLPIFSVTTSSWAIRKLLSLTGFYYRLTDTDCKITSTTPKSIMINFVLPLSDTKIFFFWMQTLYQTDGDSYCWSINNLATVNFHTETSNNNSMEILLKQEVLLMYHDAIDLILSLVFVMISFSRRG